MDEQQKDINHTEQIEHTQPIGDDSSWADNLP